MHGKIANAKRTYSLFDYVFTRIYLNCDECIQEYSEKHISAFWYKSETSLEEYTSYHDYLYHMSPLLIE